MVAMRSANMSDPMSVPDANTGSLKRRMFTAGTAHVSSRMMNAAMSTSAAQKPSVICRDSNQSFCWPSSSTYCSAHRPLTIRPMPHQSTSLRCAAARARFCATISSSSWTKAATMARPRIPTGTLM